MVKQNLGQIFLRNEAKIPSLNTKMVTVTEVQMSSDLKSARAYVIPFRRKRDKKTVNILTEFSYLVRKALSKKLDIKFLPRLHFVGDKSFDYAERIEELIKNKKNERKKRNNQIISSNKKDVGSTAVQIGLLSEKINKLSEHFKNFKKDKHSARGLTKSVNQRKRL